MIEQYYIRPVTVDRIRTSWIISEIEQYVGWLAEQQYSFLMQSMHGVYSTSHEPFQTKGELSTVVELITPYLRSSTA